MALPRPRIVRVRRLRIDYGIAVIVTYIIGIEAIVRDNLADVVLSRICYCAIAILLDVRRPAVDGTITGFERPVGLTTPTIGIAASALLLHRTIVARLELGETALTHAVARVSTHGDHDPVGTWLYASG